MLEFVITEDQAEKICNHFGKNRNEVTDFEVSELLDRVIDDLD